MVIVIVEIIFVEAVLIAIVTKIDQDDFFCSLVSQNEGKKKEVETEDNLLNTEDVILQNL